MHKSLTTDRGTGREGGHGKTAKDPGDREASTVG